MNIDASIIKSYLKGKDDYYSHWIFNSILENKEYTFEKPNNEYKDKIKEIYEKVYTNLNGFIPYNIELFLQLFPEWEKLIDNVNVILTVGCPAPYGAMVREHNGKEFIILDLIRLMSPGKKIEDIISLILKMITHEFTHICLHADYPAAQGGYRDKLIYITFDEGFAHLLSFSDNINSYDFSELIEEYYKKSLIKLEAALSETNTLKQEEYLEEANCGAYWNKFAAISGKLYLASNVENLFNIYKAGPAAMVLNMLK